MVKHQDTWKIKDNPILIILHVSSAGKLQKMCVTTTTVAITLNYISGAPTFSVNTNSWKYGMSCRHQSFGCCSIIMAVSSTLFVNPGLTPLGVSWRLYNYLRAGEPDHTSIQVA